MFRHGSCFVRSSVLTTIFSLTIPLTTFAQNTPDEIKVSQSKNVSVTVYNQDFGIVRETRNLFLREGTNFVRFEDVAEKIDPTTVSFKSLTSPDAVSVLEQNFQYDVLNVANVLDKSVGKKLTIKHYGNDGRITSDIGTLLAPPHESGQFMIRTDSGVVLNSSGEVEISELPSGMVPKPSLLWKLNSQKAGEHSSEIAYQTKSMDWHCDYVAIVNEEENEASLNGWVTINNNSGATYGNAAIKLLAGDINQIGPQGPDADYFTDKPILQAGFATPPFQESSFSEYHLYTLNGRTDLKDKESKQMSLFNADKILTTKKYVFDSQTAELASTRDNSEEQVRKVATKLEIQNKKDNQLGMPLPKGRVRIFKKDKDGALQLIGEDEIDHTPSDEKLRLLIGNSFDLVALRKQTSQTAVSNKHVRESYEIVLRNHKKIDATITCVEHANGDCKIINSSLPFVKKSAKVFEFTVPVSAGEEAKLTYTIDTKN